MNQLKKHLVTIDNSTAEANDGQPQPRLPNIGELMSHMDNATFRERVELMVRADPELQANGAMIQHIYSNRDNEQSLKDEQHKMCLETNLDTINVKHENVSE
jgi:hypothetical protein